MNKSNSRLDGLPAKALRISARVRKGFIDSVMRCNGPLVRSPELVYLIIQSCGPAIFSGARGSPSIHNALHQASLGHCLSYHRVHLDSCPHSLLLWLPLALLRVAWDLLAPRPDPHRTVLAVFGVLASRHDHLQGYHHTGINSLSHQHLRLLPKPGQAIPSPQARLFTLSHRQCTLAGTAHTSATKGSLPLQRRLLLKRSNEVFAAC